MPAAVKYRPASLGGHWTQTDEQKVLNLFRISGMVGRWPDSGEWESLSLFLDLTQRALETLALLGNKSTCSEHRFSVPSGCDVIYSLSKNINHHSYLFTQHLLCLGTCAKDPGLRLYCMVFFSFSESDTWREGVTVADVVGECV